MGVVNLETLSYNPNRITEIYLPSKSGSRLESGDSWKSDEVTNLVLYTGRAQPEDYMQELTADGTRYRGPVEVIVTELTDPNRFGKEGY